MSQIEWPDAGLVLLGHGSTVSGESAAPIYQHAAEIRRRKLFAEVREAFWKQEPQVQAVVAALTLPRVFIVPLFISEGYFGGRVIPEQLGFGGRTSGGIRLLQRPNGNAVWYTQPVGTHPLMVEVVLGRAESVLREFPFPRSPAPSETTLFVAGHGTLQEKDSRTAVDELAAKIKATGRFGAVHAVFLEEDPKISAWHELSATRNAVVVPFFISDGMHTQADIPILLGESERTVKRRLERGLPGWRNPTEKHGKLLWYSGSVGTDARVVEIILGRVREVMGVKLAA